MEVNGNGGRRWGWWKNVLSEEKENKDKLDISQIYESAGWNVRRYRKKLELGESGKAPNKKA